MSSLTTDSSAPDGAAPEPPAGQPRALPPLWSVELLDVLGRRGRLAFATAGVLTLLALLAALAAPGAVPPRALVGGLVAITALAVGLALALALDALDVRVRGPRHVRSSGGELVALLPEAVTRRDASDLAGAVRAVQVPGTTLHLGLAPVGDDLTSTAAWTRALGETLADGGASVLLVDIATGPTGVPGIADVVRDRTPLSAVVQYDDARSLAVTGPGADRIQALQALITLPTVLPTDVDVLLVALPQIVTRSAVNASRVLDQVLFVAEANLSSRVELMASLDALRVAGCSPQVVLVDGGTYTALRPDTVAPQREREATRIDPVPLAGAGVGAGVVQGAATESVIAASAAVGAAAGVDEASAAPEPESEPELQPEPEPQLEVATEPDPEPEPDPLRSAGEPSSPLRAVDVLEAAAREQAETTLDAALVDTVPMDREEVRAATSTVVPPPAPVTPEPVATASEPAAPAPVAPAPVATPTPSATPSAPNDEELTTELSVDTGPLPSWASASDEEDLLRTTVQMSVFNEELDLRDED